MRIVLKYRHSDAFFASPVERVRFQMKHLTQLNYVNVVAKTGSIRKAAEQLNITSTALNRRILALEEELGCPIFERLPQGVRLNVAGELLIQHIRYSMADLSKVLSQIADLSGVIGSFLPPLIASYRAHHKGVTFEILRRQPEAAMRDLQDFSCDIALIFGSVPPTDYQVLATTELDLIVAMRNGHPLQDKQSVTLSNCQDYPVIMPSDLSGISDLLFHAQAKRGIKLGQIITSESYEFMANNCRHEDAISFLFPLTNEAKSSFTSDIITKPFAARERLSGLLHVVQAKGRVLPVAAAKFAEDIVQNLNAKFPDSLN